MRAASTPCPQRCNRGCRISSNSLEDSVGHSGASMMAIKWDVSCDAKDPIMQLGHLSGVGLRQCGGLQKLGVRAIKGC